MPSAPQHSFLGEIPKATIRPFRGPVDTLEQMATHALGDKGERSVIVRRFTEWVTGQVHPKAYDGEIVAIRNASVQRSPKMPWVPMLRYGSDPTHVEWIKTPERMVKEISANGYTVVDCDDIATLIATMCLQIGREVELVAVGFAPNQLSHVLVRAKEPKSGQWIILDGVAGPREREAASKAKEILIRSLF